MRFIATADWQLGKQALFLPAEARARYAQARLDAVAAIGHLAEEVGADCVLVGGDVFESNQLDRAIIGRTMEVLRGFTAPVYLLPGNHDPLDAASIYDSKQFQSSCPPNIHVLRSSGPAASLTCGDGTEADIYAAPWFSKDPRTDLVAGALEQLEPKDDRVRVLVGHGNVTTLQANRDSLDVIDVAGMQRHLAEGDLDFVVLGDRHGLHEVADRIWYPGTPEVTAEREVDPGHVLVVDIDPLTRACDVQVRKVGTWEFQVVDAEVNNAADIEELLTRLDAIETKTRTSVKLALRGTLTISEHAHLSEELESRGDLLARLDYWARHTDLAVIADDADFSDMGLSGFASAALQELQTTAQNDELPVESQVARDAIGLLYRLGGTPS